MEGYYDETLKEIKELEAEGKYRDALSMIDQELKMPYIPEEFENEIRRIRRDLVYYMNESREEREDSLDTLLRKLKGSPQMQLAAASKLCSRNLRECLDEIKEWLQNEPQPEASSLIIEALAQQEISDEFILKRNDIEYTFWSDSVTPCNESEGFLEALDYLVQWLGTSHPDLLQMSRSVLIHEVYMFLPLSYDAGEGKDLALSVVKQVSELMDDGEVYSEIAAAETALLKDISRLS